MDTAAWLRELGLEQYEAAFRDNAIDFALLPDLTAEDLKEIGVAALGHRKRLLTAIAAMKEGGSPTVGEPATPPSQSHCGEKPSDASLLSCSSTLLVRRCLPGNLIPRRCKRS